MRFAFILFAITLILQPIGQILEKKGVIQIGAIQGLSSLVNYNTLHKLFTNPFILLGILCSATSLVLWLAVLSNVKLSYIYPLGSLSYITVTVLAVVFLGESVTWVRMGGICMIVAGCFLVNA